MENNFRIVSKKLLAVEGKDECNFFEALLKFEGLAGIQVVPIGGKDKFQFELPLLMKLEGFRNIETIGFIRDAENLNADAAFKSICQMLRHNNLPAPNALNELSNSKPNIGVFIMPDNQHQGTLESLCLRSLEGRKILDCINDFLSCFYSELGQSEKERFNEPKSRVLSYLAARVPIVNSLGLAALNGHWDFKHPCFDELKKFLHSLF